MSLQLWLPLNGDLTNNGLIDINLTCKSPSWSDAGKIGKCANFSGTASNVIYSNTTQFNYTDNFSFSLWLYHDTTTENTYKFAFTVGRADMGSWGYGINAISPTQIRVYFGEHHIAVNCSANTWHHVAATIGNNQFNIYVDGALVNTVNVTTRPTYTEADGLGIGCFHYKSGDIYFFNGKINDFRIYDHCLSPKEVKEISKGLILHYPLSSPYDIGFTNKYSNEYAEGYGGFGAGNLGIYTVTKLKNERGYNYKFNHTGVGTDGWLFLSFPNFAFTPEKRYQYSCKIRLNKMSNMRGFHLRAARINNDWAKPAAYDITYLPMDGQWHIINISAIIPATFSDRTGSVETANPCFEFCSNNLNGNGTIYELDFDLKDVQVVECDYPVEFIENEFLDTTIYDTSGYKNNGVPTNLKLSGDSPRGANCYIFDGTSSGIVVNHSNINPVITAGGSNQFSYSFWVKSAANDRGIIFGDHQTEGLDASISIEKYTGNILRIWWRDTLNEMLSTVTLPVGEWVHIGITYNGSKLQIYKNGNLISTITITLPVLNKSSTSIFYMGRDTRTDNTMFEGNLSDFRIYATCLSDADIQELYNKPISIDNKGNLFAQEIVEEVSSASKFEKSGIVKAEDISFAPIQDMKIKTLDDGSVWARILHHNNKSGTVVFTSSNVMNIQSIDLYSRLYLLENFRDSNGAFEFIAIQPELSDKIYRWKQTNNPTKSGSISGYVNVQNGLGGLVYGPASQTLMSVSGTTSNWWCAVGCYVNYNNGLPGFDQKIVNQTLDFYVRIDTLPKNSKFNIYNKFIECEDIIEN